jgi:hypothetical protein
MSRQTMDALHYILLQFASDRIAMEKSPPQTNISFYNPPFRWQN